jgi:hypothetical protein
MPRFNNYPDSFSKVIRRRSDNLSTTISPLSQNVIFRVTIRLKTSNTIDTVFTNEDFERGTNAAAADSVQLYNPKTGAGSQYYVRASDGTWRDAVGNSAANVRIQNNSVIGIVRRAVFLKNYTLKDTARATTYSPF